MSGEQAANVAKETEFPQSPTISWLAGLFGQCYKGQATEGELLFDDDKKGKKEKKGKKSKKPAQQENRDSSPIAAKATGRKTSRYMVDNSALQVKHRPGLAYRSSKCDDDKVKSEPRPAKWGEVVEGIDEGDGWLKVGDFYLPMMRQGVPVVTPVVESKSPPKAKADEELSPRAPATPLTNSARRIQSLDDSVRKPDDSAPKPELGPPEGNPDMSERTCEGTGTECFGSTPEIAAPAAPVELASATASESDTKIAHNEHVLSSGADVDRVDEPDGDVPSSALADKVVPKEQVELDPQSDGVECGLKSENVSADKSLLKDVEEEDMIVRAPEHPARAWHALPSVGTWLQILPRVEAERSSDDAAGCHDCKDGALEQSRVEFYHLPSVGTWLRSIPAASVRSHGSECSAKCDELDPTGVDEMIAPDKSDAELVRDQSDVLH